MNKIFNASLSFNFNFISIQKHHYHELTAEVQNILGCIPNEFTNYWINKFPQLISHTYHAFSICSNEPIFKLYYNNDYHFTRPEYFDADDALFPLLMREPKLLLKQNTAAGGVSPKKQRTPEKQQKMQNRKGLYNFRKSNAEDIDGGVGGGGVGVANPTAGVGLQRNLDAITLNATAADNVDDNKRDVFANFKFRRYSKTANRNNYNNNMNSNANKEKNVTWTLPQQDN